MKYPEVDLCYLETDTINSNGKTISKVLDYWKWAHSNLLDNAERGIFAEYLVACAIGGQQKGRINWEKYDLVTTEGITIEVKTSAYIQIWGQNVLSSIRFGIAESFGYNRENNKYVNERKRQADVYVFCVHNETNQSNIEILNVEKWDFYILASKIINQSEVYSKAKSIGLVPLQKLGAVKCKFEEVHQTIINAGK